MSNNHPVVLLSEHRIFRRGVRYAALGGVLASCVLLFPLTGSAEAPPSAERHTTSVAATTPDLPPPPMPVTVGARTIRYNDARVTESVDGVLTYLEGSFGALVMVVMAIAGVLLICAGRFGLSLVCIIVAITVFVLRSMMATYFNDQSILGGSTDSSYVPRTYQPSSANQYPARAVPTTTTLTSAMGERYLHAPAIGFRSPLDNPLSSFSIDVDTASYANIRRFITQGSFPPRDAIRIEECVNYFDYEYPSPNQGPFGVSYEMAPSPFEPGRTLLALRVAAGRATFERRAPRNLVFLLDVSGSMLDRDKLPLLRELLRFTVQDMNSDDRLSLVTYSDRAAVPFEGLRKRDVAVMLPRIDALVADGSTNGSGALQLAYEIALRNRIEGGVNRVILASDGDFNVGITSHAELVALIEEKRRTGVFLSVLGVGTGNLNDANLEQLANHGNGDYHYLDSYEEGRRVFDRSLDRSGTPVAKDVKLQVEFNPAHVRGYRLLGYANRTMTAEEFVDDAKDAGEIGEGQTVTALYELELASAASVAELRYAPRLTGPEMSASDELGFLKIRFKAPDASSAAQRNVTILASEARPTFESASDDLRFAAAVARFAEILRRGNSGIRPEELRAVQAIAHGARGNDPGSDRRGFVDLVGSTLTLVR